MNNFTDIEWWKSATLDDLKGEITNGNDPFGPCKFDDLKATPLHYASKYGSLELIKYLLDLGADPNSPATYGTRPTHKAAEANRLDVLRLLHRYAADLSLPCNASLHSLSTLEHAYLWSGKACAVNVAKLAPDSFTSAQYRNVLFWMKRDKLKKSPEYRQFKNIFKQRKAAEKARKGSSERFNSKPKKPIIKEENLKTVMNWVFIIIGIMILVSIFGGGGEDVYNDMYENSRTLRRR